MPAATAIARPMLEAAKGIEIASVTLVTFPEKYNISSPNSVNSSESYDS